TRLERRASIMSTRRVRDLSVGDQAKVSLTSSRTGSASRIGLNWHESGHWRCRQLGLMYGSAPIRWGTFKQPAETPGDESNAATIQSLGQRAKARNFSIWSP